MPMQMVGSNDPQWLRDLWERFVGQNAPEGTSMLGTPPPSYGHATNIGAPRPNPAQGPWVPPSFQPPSPGSMQNNLPMSAFQTHTQGQRPPQLPQGFALPGGFPIQRAPMQPLPSHGAPQGPPLMPSHGGMPGALGGALGQLMPSHGGGMGALGGALGGMLGQPQRQPMRPPNGPPQAPTGPYGGNDQSSAVGGNGATVGMSQGLSPELLAMLQGPQQELGNFSQRPQVPQMQGGANSQLQHAGSGGLGSLLRAVLGRR